MYDPPSPQLWVKLYEYSSTRIDLVSKPQKLIYNKTKKPDQARPNERSVSKRIDTIIPSNISESCKSTMYI